LDARQSNSQIGKKVGVSKDIVNYRIKQLEKRGIIKGYHTILDVSKLGYITFRMFLKFHDITREKEKEIINYLIHNPKVGWLVSVEGNWNINMLVWCESVYDFKRFLNTFLKEYKNYVDDKWISIITEMFQYDRSYLVSDKRESMKMAVTGGSNTKADLDKTDLDILNILASDSRAPLLDIGNKLNVSSKVVSYRIKQMIDKGVIQRFKALFDLDILGIDYYKVLFSFKNITEQREKDFLAYMRINPYVIIVVTTIGGADFEVELNVENNKQFRKIMDDIELKFSDIIIKYETLRYYKEYKWNYLPVDAIIIK